MSRVCVSNPQATFDTVAGAWSDVYLPWHNFVPVKRAQSDPEGAGWDAALGAHTLMESGCINGAPVRVRCWGDPLRRSACLKRRGARPSARLYSPNPPSPPLPAGAPLNPSRISKLGLVLSRFEFNKAPNPS